MRGLIAITVLFAVYVFFVGKSSPVRATTGAEVIEGSRACLLMCAEVADPGTYCAAGEVAYRPANYCGCGYDCAPACTTDSNCPSGQSCQLDPATNKGHCSAPSFKKKSPTSGTTVPYGTVTFSWTAASSTSSYYPPSYSISFTDAATGKAVNPYNPLYTQNTTLSVSLPSVGLQPGSSYTWSVTAHTGGSLDIIQSDDGTPWTIKVAPATLLSCATATEDSYLMETSPATNYGTSAQVKAGAAFVTPIPGYPTNTIFYLTYYKFNTTQFPTNYDTALLKLYQSSCESGAGGLPVNLYRINGAWSENALVWANKPAYDSTIWGTLNVGCNASGDSWYRWDITNRLKSTTIPNGLMLADQRYSPSCDGQYSGTSTSTMCRAGASRTGVLNSKEAASNKPQICFYTNNSSSSSSSVCAKSTGDANCDGKVNVDDYNIWKSEYLGTATTKNANFDAPSDNTVDLVDFEIWRSHAY